MVHVVVARNVIGSSHEHTPYSRPIRRIDYPAKPTKSQSQAKEEEELMQWIGNVESTAVKLYFLFRSKGPALLLKVKLYEALNKNS